MICSQGNSFDLGLYEYQARTKISTADQITSKAERDFASTKAILVNPLIVNLWHNVSLPNAARGCACLLVGGYAMVPMYLPPLDWASLLSPDFPAVKRSLRISGSGCHTYIADMRFPMRTPSL